MPFTCSYNYCERTFSGRAALREHIKSHNKAHTYWETLNRTSDNNINDEVEGTVCIFLKLFPFCILIGIV